MGTNKRREVELTSPVHYQALREAYGLTDHDVTGINEKGETVVVSVTESCAVIATYQRNGWRRTNTYYPSGVEEEIYG